jgi:Trypsin
MAYEGSPLAGPTAFPWTAALLADGQYVCGATIIHEQFVMTSVVCAINLLRYVHGGKAKCIDNKILIIAVPP